MSLIGKKVESFKAKAFHNGQFIDITDENMRGKWSAVVFYPADFTFVCPTELEDLANLYEDFKKENCEIYSVSTDTEYVHKAWHDSSERVKKVQYPMIADPTGKLSRMFEVMIEEEGLALRGSFIIDPEGVIQAYEVHSNGIGREASELLRKLQAAKFVRENGEVCPAKWKPGKESLKPTIDLIGKL
ncbi:alkyl hydroperoxide reductase subunit C [Fusobacterium sp.]|jgi:peroxiredoxin|uniref:alkyl hydroperoxide reductase subunit C n=1 Tax=Fusobacterium sp. TaxID=68766 RepID=UPI0015A6E909|nr:alkyl hydroperoxide reductase subunit C [Fusobacterium sp.]MDY2980344.1 alkyl hydroperoxide reductase subunit C [Fusobacterium sp.]